MNRLKLHLWPEEPIEKNDHISTGFTLEEANGKRKTVWYRTPTDFAASITRWCDPYVLAVLFKAMGMPADLMVHGKVSPSLIFNLKEFQAAWNIWFPDRYSAIEILPDIEQERKKPDHKNALTAFSGGADSCYTAWRYSKSTKERLRYSLSAGLFILGVEFPAKYIDTYDRASQKAKFLLDSIGMTLIPMATNLRSIRQDPLQSGGAFLASCLMLLQEGYLAGLIPSAYPYAHLLIPCGSSPLTDRMMSSDSFTIVHHGAGAPRIEKLEAITGWTEAMQHLRVCLGRDPAQRDRNCGRCEKCARNILEFRALGYRNLPFFNNDLTIWQILKIQYSYSTDISQIYEDILRVAKNKNTSGAWTSALKIAMLINKLRFRVEKIPWLNHFLRKLKHRLTFHRRDMHVKT